MDSNIYRPREKLSKHKINYFVYFTVKKVPGKNILHIFVWKK